MAETTAPDDGPSTSTGPMTIDGSEEDSILSSSELLTRQEVLKRRSRRLRQLARVYKDHYWSLMEELKHKYKEYYWEYGKSPFQEDEDREILNRTNGARGGGEGSGLGFVNRCGVHGCKSKSMALTKFCHTHILADSKQKLYKGCSYVIKRELISIFDNNSGGTTMAAKARMIDGSDQAEAIESPPITTDTVGTVQTSQAGPILCGKPILRSTVPSLCSPHFQKAEKHVARALKKAGLNVSSTSKLAPKLHVIVAEYVCQIQTKRRAAQKVTAENPETIEEDIMYPILKDVLKTWHFLIGNLASRNQHLQRLIVEGLNSVVTTIEQRRDRTLRDELDHLWVCEEQYWAQQSAESCIQNRDWEGDRNFLKDDGLLHLSQNYGVLVCKL
ncbi:hypothetical protein RJ639_045445 [Escallonia herrerae]|uniref:KAT8 regulatory NSL complex subunit 2 n=1 Tax=Escallonia herrerae TaxID=1293975 RepID=A0AA89AZC4_9ASTE|nr:hypothetical protein RJ639_045445 [Escallonia herrerae]